MSVICNHLLNLSGFSAQIQIFLVAVVGWLAGLIGMRLIDAETQLLPPGCRPIPSGHFNFDPAMAELLGIPKAIIFQRIQAWIDHNRRAGRNIRDGQAWSYNSYPQWAADIRLYHQKTIEKHIREMEVLGILKGAQLEQRDGIQTKWYSSPLGLSDGVSQMLLWPESGTPMGGAQVSDDFSRNKPAKHKRSMPKDKTPTPAARGYGAVNVGVVATFDIPTGELSEGKNESAEVPEIRDEHEGYTFEGATAATSDKTLPPVPPAPLSDDTPTEEETVSVDRTEDAPALPEWADRFTPSVQLDRILANAGQAARLQGWLEYADTQDSIKNPPGFALVMMRGKHKPPQLKSDGYDWSDQYVPMTTQEILAEIDRLEGLAADEHTNSMLRDFYRRDAAELRAELAAEGGAV